MCHTPFLVNDDEILALIHVQNKTETNSLRNDIQLPHLVSKPCIKIKTGSLTTIFFIRIIATVTVRIAFPTQGNTFTISLAFPMTVTANPVRFVADQIFSCRRENETDYKASADF